MTPRRSSETTPLSRAHILDAAVAYADAHGIAALSMRKLAKELGVEAMSLYYHLPNKDAILQGMIDRVFDAIELPEGSDWQEGMRRRARSTRAVLLAHPWALGLMDACTQPGEATLRHHDAVLGCLFDAGFSTSMTAHAFALLDSFIFGFVLQEISLPFESTQEVHESAERLMDDDADASLPNLERFVREHVMRPDFDFGQEFEFGLTLLLDSLEQRRVPSNP